MLWTKAIWYAADDAVCQSANRLWQTGRSAPNRSAPGWQMNRTANRGTIGGEATDSHGCSQIISPSIGCKQSSIESEHLCESVFVGGSLKGNLMSFHHKDITEQIIGASFEVYNTLGYGFLEKVYKNAMQVELIKRGLACLTESPIQVRYKQVVVGEYFADLFVDEKVIVELKVAKEYNSADEAQLLNKLKATGITVGLLINFGKDKVEFKRLAM